MYDCVIHVGDTYFHIRSIKDLGGNDKSLPLANKQNTDIQEAFVFKINK